MTEDRQPGWYTDPENVHEGRWWDGMSFTSRVHDGGVESDDPLADAALAATAPIPLHTATMPTVDAADAARSTRKRRWVWPAIAVGALVVGIGIGAAASTDQSKLDKADQELATTKAQLKRVEAQRDALRKRLNDRGSQQQADEAAAARLKAEQEAADKKKMEDALAEQQRQAAAAAAAEAARNTIDGDGVYAIGTDKNPGRYKTTGSPSSCYWGITSDPNGSNIIENNFGDGVAYAQVSAGQYFETKGCGSWTKVG